MESKVATNGEALCEGGYLKIYRFTFALLLINDL